MSEKESTLWELEEKLLLLTPETVQLRITELEKQLRIWRAILASLPEELPEDTATCEELIGPSYFSSGAIGPVETVSQYESPEGAKADEPFLPNGDVVEFLPIGTVTLSEPVEKAPISATVSSEDPGMDLAEAMGKAFARHAGIGIEMANGKKPEPKEVSPKSVREIPNQKHQDQLARIMDALDLHGAMSLNGIASASGLTYTQVHFIVRSKYRSQFVVDSNKLYRIAGLTKGT